MHDTYYLLTLDTLITHNQLLSFYILIHTQHPKFQLSPQAKKINLPWYFLLPLQ